MRKISYRNKNKLKSEKQVTGIKKVYISFKKWKNYLAKITKKVFKIKK